MIAIHKYVLEEGLPSQLIDMPVGARFLSVQMQDRKITLWCIVDTDAPASSCPFFVVGTGHNITDAPWKYNSNFLGTVQNGPWAWHVFGNIAVGNRK